MQILSTNRRRNGSIDIYRSYENQGYTKLFLSNEPKKFIEFT